MPMDELITEVDRLQAGLQQAKRVALRQIGGQLLKEQKAHFVQLSKTGSSNGVIWPRHSPSTLAKRQALQRRGLLARSDPEQIGIRTGNLLESFRYRTGHTHVDVTNTDAEAFIFAARRPIFPPSVPPAWVNASETILQDSVDQVSN